MVSAILSAPFNVFRDRLRQNVCTKSANNIYAKHNQYQAFQLLTGLIRNSHCPLVSRSFIEDAVSNFLKGYIDDVSVTEIFIYSNVFHFNQHSDCHFMFSYLRWVIHIIMSTSNKHNQNNITSTITITVNYYWEKHVELFCYCLFAIRAGYNQEFAQCPRMLVYFSYSLLYCFIKRHTSQGPTRHRKWGYIIVKYRNVLSLYLMNTKPDKHIQSLLTCISLIYFILYIYASISGTHHCHRKKGEDKEIEYLLPPFDDSFQ